MKDKIKNIMFAIYREMYLEATPSADFDELVADAVINEGGEKVIDFLSYFLSAEKQDEIISKHLKGKMLTKAMQNSIRIGIVLGCSPTSNCSVNVC